MLLLLTYLHTQLLTYLPAYLLTEAFGLYPYPAGHVKDNYAMADVERAARGGGGGLDRFPALSRVRGAATTLSAGEVLYLPRYHWHLVRQVGRGRQNVSLNCWVGGKGNDAFNEQAALAAQAAQAAQAAMPAEARPEQLDEPVGDEGAGEEGAWGAEAFEAWLRRDSAVALTAFKAGRLAEAVAARACGGNTALGGELLTDIAAGEDRGWPPTSKPHRIARRLRAQLGALLGSQAAAAALLRALTQDGRLHPGLSDASGDVVSWDG